MKNLHIFTEEPSIKEVLDVLLQTILPPELTYRIYPHQGKNDLENGLRKTIPTLSKIPDSRIIITRDQDDLNCLELKEYLDQIVIKTIYCPYKIRIVCRELESWFLGDLNALEQTFPRFRMNNVQNKREMSNVDSISKPSLYLLRNIPEYSSKDYLPKIGTAKAVAPNMDFSNNQSCSFNQMVNAIKDLLEIQD